MYDRTMYICMEIIALINLLRGKLSPLPPKKEKKKQEMLQYVTNAPKVPCDTPSHYALSFCDVSLNLLQ